ncbi:MAG: tRNA (adenosine(37)-N6)-dimethylallyltransferase MiaA [Bdellovibrionales bacterium]|nr:tRNA (adenosine(37)-N6)-dimethylallyltransferase MiaA [Bdellovibrionales bacterium]
MVSENRVAVSTLVTPILTGPTAAGKTAYALDQASRLGLEIINADSLIVYKGFDLGTAKPTSDELSRVPHHLVNIREPEEPYTAAEFVRDVKEVLSELEQRKKRALIVGGTPFYIKALTFGLWEAPPTNLQYRETLKDLPTPKLYETLLRLDPQHAKKIGKADRYRMVRALEILEFSETKPSKLEAEAQSRAPNPQFPLWVIDRPADDLESRIQNRTNQMIRQGLLEEAQKLRMTHPGTRALSSVGYAQALDYLDQKTPDGRKPRAGLAGLADEIALATRQLVKAQRTFFKGMSHAQWFLFEQDRPKLDQIVDQAFESTR